MINVSIIGATGYTGAELLRILALHSQVKLMHLTSQSYVGQSVGDVYPHLKGIVDLTLEEQDLGVLAADSDVIFLALPHGHAIEVAADLVKSGKRVIDLGADFRFRDTGVYEQWYKVKHLAPDISQSAVYGLPELNRAKIKDAQVIGNPGCYPTSAALALAPLIKSKVIALDSIIIDSKSGVSGAGRTLAVGSLYAECAENLKAYNVAKHRHTPEIEGTLSEIAGEDVLVSFTPHLIPMTRGILTTAYAKLNTPGVNLTELYQEFYQDEYFVRIQSPDVWPQTKCVAGTNFCDIGVTFDPRTKRVVVSSVIDNLVKGAAGQAVQNMNIMFGIPEKTGLEMVPMYP